MYTIVSFTPHAIIRYRKFIRNVCSYIQCKINLMKNPKGHYTYKHTYIHKKKNLVASPVVQIYNHSKLVTKKVLK